LPAHFAHSLSGLSIVAHPQELWWPLARLRAPAGVTPAHFLPGPVTAHGRELAVALALGAAAMLARNRRRRPEDCIALLALGLLLRCLLDPSDHVYYHLPFVIALCAWEARTRGWPLLSLLATAGLYAAFNPISGSVGLTAQFATYLAVALPLLAALAGPALGFGARVSSRRDDRHRGSRSIPPELARSA
jgi:hypothetical protein